MQQRFWSDPQPLVERLGRDFFRTLPERPGVYLMHGASGTTLYVGKAKNLRKRLGSYRVANPERMPRRHLRMLRAVEAIEFQECVDERAALAREADLLRTLKPRFNRAGVWPGRKRFLAWKLQPEGLAVAVTEAPEAEWARMGPFGAQALQLHRTLVRLLWCRLIPDAGLMGMPPGWSRGAHGDRVILSPRNESALAETFAALTSLDKNGPESFRNWMPPATSLFEKQFHEEDVNFLIEQLSHWKDRGGRLDPPSIPGGGQHLDR